MYKKKKIKSNVFTRANTEKFSIIIAVLVKLIFCILGAPKIFLSTIKGGQADYTEEADFFLGGGWCLGVEFT